MSALEDAFQWYAQRGRAAAESPVAGGVNVQIEMLDLLLSGTDVDPNELGEMIGSLAQNGAHAVGQHGVDPTHVLSGLFVCGFLIGYRTRVEQEGAATDG